MGRKAYAEQGRETKRETAKGKTEDVRRWILDHLPSSYDQAVSVADLLLDMEETDLFYFAPARWRVSANMSALHRQKKIHRRRKIVGRYIHPVNGEELRVFQYFYWRV